MPTEPAHGSETVIHERSGCLGLRLDGRTGLPTALLFRHKQGEGSLPLALRAMLVTGGEEDLRELVDACHVLGMRVILDILLHGVIDQEVMAKTGERVRSGPYRARLAENTTNSWGLTPAALEATDIAWSRHILDFEPYWYGSSPLRHPLVDERPEWFMRDSEDNIIGIYTRAFDVANVDWQEYFSALLVNLSDTPVEATCLLNLDRLRLDDGEYKVYDAWNDRAMGAGRRYSYNRAGLRSLHLAWLPRLRAEAAGPATRIAGSIVFPNMPVRSWQSLWVRQPQRGYHGTQAWALGDRARGDGAMKIRDIRTVGLRGATPTGGWSNELEPHDNVHTLLAIHTSEGLVGYGSVFTSEDLVRAALKVLEPLYLGENALEAERVSEKLHQNTFWQGRGGALTHAISGIDIALWDILGKATHQPVGRLLGGRYREQVLPYASLLMEEPGSLSDHLISLKEQGFRAFKIGWGPFGRKSDKLDEGIVKAARETVGDETLLAVDAGGSDAYWQQGYKWALKTSYMLAHYDVAWFEEPLDPDALEDHVALRRNAPMTISGGEVFTRRQSFEPYLKAGAFDVVQPDVTKVGGISEERRISWMAEENGARMIPHGWNTAVGLAADLQLASALPKTDLVEYKTGSPYIDEITTGGWKLDQDGMMPIPDAPGLGIEIDHDAVAGYSGGRSLLDG